MAVGRTTLNFGTGAPDASVSVAFPSITSAHVVDAWVMALGTADHSADEHMVEPLRVVAGDVTAGTGFVIRGLLESPGVATGVYTVAWQVSYPGES